MKRILSICNRDADAEIIKEDLEDDMKTIIKCPYCGKQTTVGETIMISGFVGCPNCYWDKEHGLLDTVMNLKEHAYQEYASGDFYRRGYKGEKNDGRK